MAWSPYSVTSGLSMLAMGARGQSRAELAEILTAHHADATSTEPNELAELAEQCARAADISQDAADAHRSQCEVVNRIWLRRDISVRDEFREAALAWPGGNAEHEDFAHDPAGARHRINSVIRAATHDLIPELLRDTHVTNDSQAVLANALWLRAAWQEPFSPSHTAPGEFRTITGRRLPVPMMAATRRLDYAEADGWRMVTLPTHGPVDVEVLLPEDDLSDLERCLSASTLAAAAASRRRVLVDLRMPRFRVMGSVDVMHALKEFGLHAVFSDEADFSGISPDPLMISAAAHQAVLSLDEQGLEGAAATAVVARVSAVREPAPVPFYVDRPFLVRVKHEGTGLSYFFARITEPIDPSGRL